MRKTKDSKHAYDSNVCEQEAVYCVARGWVELNVLSKKWYI